MAAGMTWVRHSQPPGEPHTNGPFGESVWEYRRAGWLGTLPLLFEGKPHKKTPPGGFTGWAGVVPSGADVQAWLEEGRGVGNIAIHLGDGFYGLDVDAYGAKRGEESLAALEAELGPLPPTWISSSRTDPVSGIRFFRAELPLGRVWVDIPAPGIEAIHRGHRYAVVQPSVHPDTGQTYTWRWSGESADAEWVGPRFGIEDVRPDSLPWLPAAWIERLSMAGDVRSGEMAGHAETVRVVSTWRDDEPCPMVTEARQRALAGLAAAALGEGLHPTSNGSIFALVSLGHEGHSGVRRALAEHYQRHVSIREARGDLEGVAEWWRMVRGAVGKLQAADYRERCQCDLWNGAGVSFTPEDLGVVLPAPRTAGDLWADPGPIEGGQAAGNPYPDNASGPPAGPAVSMLDQLRAKMLTPAQLVARTPPRPLVAGLLYQDSLAWLIGAPGSYKSFIALDIAARVAEEGGKWQGRRIWGGPVVYMAAEGGGGMSLRVQAWQNRNGDMSERMLTIPGAIQIMGPGWLALVELCREIRPALVVVDTQARTSVGVNENSNTEMSAWIAQLDLMRQATQACVLVVHHTGRGGEHARGASAIDGAQDTELRVEKAAAPLRALLVTDKQKEGADDVQVTIELAAVELGTDPHTEEPLSSLAVIADAIGDPHPVRPYYDPAKLTETQGMIMRILRDHFSAIGATAAQVAQVWQEQGGALGAGKWVKSTFYASWNRLAEKSLICKIKGTQKFRAIDAGENGASEFD